MGLEERAACADRERETVSALGDMIQETSTQLAMNWAEACERLLLSQGATPADYVLVTQQVGDGQNAWVQLQTEPIRPRYPMVQMRFEGMGITTRIVESSENGSEDKP